MDRRLRLALAISLSAHLVLLAGGRYRLSYDAYIHMFFADHYRISWWSVWEPRWYAGFSVTSYPPLFHQLLALLSLPLGMEVAFAGLTLGVLAALTVAVYAYAGIFVARREAATAALLAALLPSFYLTAHTFGQIPTLFGLAVALLGLRALANYLKSGEF